MWTYSQSTGQLTYDGVLVGTGYAGRGDDKNRPEAQSVVNEGPLPAGRYTIGAATTHPHLGPFCMALAPDPANEMFGRSGFFIHADSMLLAGQASEGCIVLPHDARVAVAIHPDRLLEVVE